MEGSTKKKIKKERVHRVAEEEIVKSLYQRFPENSKGRREKT